MTTRLFRPATALWLISCLCGVALLGACSCNRNVEPAGVDPAGASDESPADAAEATQPAESPGAEESCCSQCVAASRKDPSGMDLSLVACRDYANSLVNGTPALDPSCLEWFAQHHKLVQDCR